MRKMTSFVATAFIALAFAVPASATIINLDAVDNAAHDWASASQNYKSLALNAGTYKVIFVEDDYTAFTRWDNVTGCDTDGTHCVRGWENSAIFSIGSDGTDLHYMGDAGATGDYGPKLDGAYYETAAQSLAHAAIYSYLFTLDAADNVYFFIGDQPTSDNHGGVSLSVVAVPEPATWAMLIAGFGMIGLLVTRRRKATVRTAT